MALRNDVECCENDERTTILISAPLAMKGRASACAARSSVLL
jgi:hypothetical protein